MYGKRFCTTNEESWILVNFTENKNGIKKIWLFRIKERDELKQCEARLLTRDFIQKQGNVC
jgi:hypothetical protein